MNHGSPADEAAQRHDSVVAIIVNYRTPDLAAECLACLSGERATLPNLRAVVVDGGSNDSSAGFLGELVAKEEYRDWVRFMALELNGGFGWANNQAILALARETQPPEFVYLLNPDAKVTRGSLAALVSDLVQHPRCAAAGSQLLNPDGSAAASAFRFPSAAREMTAAAASEKLAKMLGVPSMVVEAGHSIEVDWVTGASVLLRSQALREVGLFDDGFFLYFDEVELMHRLRKRGWTSRHVPASRVFHLEGAATGLGAADARPFPKYWYESRRRYFALTGGRPAVLGANLGWLLGRVLSLPKRLLGRSTRSRAILSNLLSPPWATRRDVSSSAPAWGEAPGRPPKWILDRD